MQQMTLAVIGTGAWGTTLAALAAEQGHQVRVWSRRSSHSLESTLEQADVILSAVSMKGVKAIAAEVESLLIPSHSILVTATKGLDPIGTSRKGLPLLPSQIWQAALPHHPVVILSGPNLSKEIDQGLPAATVVASSSAIAANQVQTVFSSNRFRVYTNPDPLGVELGGTLKNIMAIAVGTCDGLNLGENAKAALMTRGLAEIIRIGTYWGAQIDTFYGLSGLGDLLATCNSPLSRNYQVGYGLAQGKGLSDVLASLQGTAEGVNTTQVLMQIAHRQEITVPISYQVSRLLAGDITPQAAVAALMLRDIKPE